MKYALNLAEDGRVLSVTYEEYGGGSPLAEELPEGDTYNYRWVKGKFIYDPVKTEKTIRPGGIERTEAKNV